MLNSRNSACFSAGTKLSGLVADNFAALDKTKRESIMHEADILTSPVTVDVRQPSSFEIELALG